MGEVRSLDEARRKRERELSESQSHHPAGKRRRCPEKGCGHVYVAHTAEAQNGTGGCAYCGCGKVYS